MQSSDSGQKCERRTCFDVVEVVMDDCEVITRREITFRSNSGEFASKTVQNDEGTSGNDGKFVIVADFPKAVKTTVDSMVNSGSPRDSLKPKSIDHCGKSPKKEPAVYANFKLSQNKNASWKCRLGGTFEGNPERQVGRILGDGVDNSESVKLKMMDCHSDVIVGSPNGNLTGGLVQNRPEWGAVQAELFKGLGLVPRGVLHDIGRPVDRRHCVTGRRTVEADPELAERREAAERHRNVFYPSGVPTMFDTEKFIGEIRKRPAIYDVRSKVYSNRIAKLKYWHEVGKEMYRGWEELDQIERRSLVKELQIKWKSIRDHFMRQLKQNINGEGPRKKKYVHFDQLQFLTANLGVKRPRHAYKLPKTEPEEYMEFTPELPEERHFSFVSSDYDEREVPVAALLPASQPEDLSQHREPAYYHHQDLSYHKELEGDMMGNKMFLLSLLPILERLTPPANIRARLQLMEVLQGFVAHEDAPRRDFYVHVNHHDVNGKRDCDVSRQHSTTSHSDSDS